jgi:hypothetical protein
MVAPTAPSNQLHNGQGPRKWAELGNLRGVKQKEARQSRASVKLNVAGD